MKPNITNIRIEKYITKMYKYLSFNLFNMYDDYYKIMKRFDFPNSRIEDQREITSFIIRWIRNETQCFGHYVNSEYMA